jgi:outer membrane murein-binding lipoprotein Lpp
MVAALALSSVFFASCSPEVTESDEYQELLAELDKVERERDLARSEIEDAESSRVRRKLSWQTPKPGPTRWRRS